MINDKVISQYEFGSFLIATLPAEYLLKQISSLTVIQLYAFLVLASYYVCIADNI